jgi:hypothetical protein
MSLYRHSLCDSKKNKQCIEQMKWLFLLLFFFESKINKKPLKFFFIDDSPPIIFESSNTNANLSKKA